MGETGKPAGLSSSPRLLLFILIVMCRGQEQRCDVLHSGNSVGQCCPMELTLCPYQAFNSSFIRFRGSSDDFAQFQGLISNVQDRCPEHFAKFLCQSYFTACSDRMEPLDSALPCRSFCEVAYRECNPVLRSVGITWPKKLRCKKFSRKKCISSKQTTTLNYDRPTPYPHPSATASLTCEPLTASFCETVGYSSTGFPNLLGQRSQVAAELIMQRFYPLVQIGCFDQLVEFVCSAHVPECRVGSVDNNSTSVLIMPCRSFCEAAKRACGDIIDPEMLEGSRRFWPDWVTCDLFPTQNCREFSETDEKESAQSSGLETSRNLLHELKTAGDSLSAHVQNVIASMTSGTDSCQRTAVVKGLEYALKGVQENIEMCSTFLRILDDDA